MLLLYFIVPLLDIFFLAVKCWHRAPRRCVLAVRGEQLTDAFPSVRANAFHLNSHTGIVRVVHFGNRAISLENYGSPSSLVLRAFEEVEKLRVKEALCYLAPEQTGSTETLAQDSRTDLYSLGILFWTLLVGRGQMPFEGGPLELLHSIIQKRAMPVHEVRRDVPQVLASIIEKVRVNQFSEVSLSENSTVTVEKSGCTLSKCSWIESGFTRVPAPLTGNSVFYIRGFCRGKLNDFVKSSPAHPTSLFRRSRLGSKTDSRQVQ